MNVRLLAQTIVVLRQHALTWRAAIRARVMQAIKEMVSIVMVQGEKEREGREYRAYFLLYFRY
jgi:hypothetical protein